MYRTFVSIGCGVLFAASACSPGTIDSRTAASPASSPVSPVAGSNPISIELATLVDSPDTSPLAIVTEILDGDTIRVDLGPNTETVRLLGVDTPEKHGGPRPAECHGDQATAFTESLVPVGTTVRLARDAESRDQYGRLLAYVFRDSDDLFVNHALVAFGHATATFYEPNTTFRRDFTRSALLAEATQQGFWSTCGGASVLLPLAE